MHIIGPNATELIAEAVLALEMEWTAEDLANIIHAHPTLSEAMLDASMQCLAWRSTHELSAISRQLSDTAIAADFDLTTCTDMFLPLGTTNC